ncbi:MAG: histidine--tRNA ligase [Gammaproteobacteria bacterium]|jgi:histidyl-tRNA synthetase
MAKSIQSIRGMHDILPDQTAAWRYIEGVVTAALTAYGYDEIRMPLVEMTELFSRSIGEVTDIVEKEMYTFEDRNGDSLTLRPEGTASCVRAGIEHGLLHNQQRRLWYMGPMFRHERPQKGRYRQFHQIGAETFGIPGPDIDAELIALCARIWDGLGLSGLRLEINSLGTPETRQVYRKDLIEYLSRHETKLDAEARDRLQSNPLRILDSKNPEMREVIRNAPDMFDYLDTASKTHFDQLRERLEDLGISYQVNPRLVRGLDYYSLTVFEWITDELGAQGTVCAGGRYDGLVEQLGGRATPAAGFAMGIERLLALMEAQDVAPEPLAPHAYLLMLGEAAERQGWALAERWRSEVPDLRLQVNAGGGSLKSQMKRADKSGAPLALLLADDELAAEEVTVKHLRAADAEQQRISIGKMADYLNAALN